MTNVELIVQEPNGKTCCPFNNCTNNGIISRDFTNGYGPVEYLCRFPEHGLYTFSVKLATPTEIEENPIGIDLMATTVRTTLYTNFGSKLQKEFVNVVQLSRSVRLVKVATIECKM